MSEVAVASRPEAQAAAEAFQIADLAAGPHSDWPEESRRYGLGFHRHTSSERVWMEGYDAGVSMTSLHDPATQTTITVLGNWTDAAWPMVRLLNDWLDA